MLLRLREFSLLLYAERIFSAYNGRENSLMKKDISTIILVLVLLTGFSLLLYPTISDYWNSLHQSQVITGYATAVDELDSATYENLLLSAKQYNEELVTKKNRYHPSKEDSEKYYRLLDVSDNGIIGYIEIPTLKISLAIYHGVDEGVLQIAAGHIEGTSLPVGGPSTHTVISAHRGLPSAKLFTNLDKLVEGDLFMIRVLDETLTYEVDQIRIVLPNEIEDLEIEEGKDYTTLVTCTPYGVNSHRLLVRGHRVENQASSASIRVTADAIQIDPILVAPLVALPMLLLLLILLLTRYRKH